MRVLSDAEFSNQARREAQAYEGLLSKTQQQGGKKRSLQLADALIHCIVLEVEATPSVDPIACRSGCSVCCSLRVDITATEAKRVAAALRGHPDRRVITARLKAQAAYEKKRIDPGEHVMPCAFLQDGACTIYASRPLACRSFFSSDPARCGPRAVAPVASTQSMFHALLRAKPISDAFQNIESSARPKPLAIAVLKSLKPN